MGFDFWYTAVLLLFMSYVLVKEWIESSMVVLGTLILLLVGNVITMEEAFAGFSNAGMLTIAFLFVIAGAVYNTGVLNKLTRLIFGRSITSTGRKLARILFPATAISAFLNNTPVVAMLIPVIRSWAEKNNLSLSKFLIPLSFAAILGGLCTLIGTSTNLIVHGMMLEHGLRGLSFFEISKIGVPVALLGLIYLITIGHRLLPDRDEPLVELGEHTREFVIELKVNDDYPHTGKTADEAGLRHLSGLFLFQIERGERIIAPVGPAELILVGDRLFFTGVPKTILELQKTPGLQLLQDHHFDLKQYDSYRKRTYEATISKSSPLVGVKVSESNFHDKYGAVIIAIHRNGDRIKKKIGDIMLLPGDTLLLLADQYFHKQWYHSRDFYLISKTEAIPSKPQIQLFTSIGTLVLVILIAVMGVLPLATAAGLGVVLLVVSRSISASEANRSVDYRVLITIASAFGIATAMENSGLAGFVAENIVSLGQNFGVAGVMAALFVATSVYTLIINSNAAGAFLFPIAYSAGISMNIDPRPFIITILIAAAASFATPISYQTNVMVYGPGGYKFTDFLKIGAPLQIIAGICSVFLIYYFYL